MFRFIVFSVLGFCCGAALAQNPASDPILPPLADWSGLSERLMVAPDHPWVTPSERGGLTTTPRYTETVAWLRKLVAASPQLTMQSIGTSAEGREIWMVIATENGASTPSAVAQSGKPTLLTNAGIHSGEIDGKDAGLMLLRDMTVLGTKADLLTQVNLLFIPILSVDGHERFSKFNRINQRGPEEMGWRTNARNLNLNRDFAKLETEEVRALVSVINKWKPDLYIDLHVTDGADYQPDITYGFNGRRPWSPSIATWLEETYRVDVDAALEAMGHTPSTLLFSANGRDMLGGNTEWTAGPRFSTAYADLRHLPGVLLENHSLKPYRRRVLGTYVFLEASMRALGKHADALRRAVTADRTTRNEEVALGWSIPQDTPPRTMTLKGIRSEPRISPVSGGVVTHWTGEEVIEEIPVFAYSVPSPVVKRPRFYYVPAAWSSIAAKLTAHGITTLPIHADTVVSVTMYRLPDAKLEPDPFEGRVRVATGTPEVERRELRLWAGAHIVPTDQPLGDLAVALLEPQAGDSFFRWGYFLEILQRSEYAEEYVIEPMAQRMLDDDPELKRRFEDKLLSEPEFAGDPTARLDWFYRQTPFFDAEWRLYPIARSID